MPWASRQSTDIHIYTAVLQSKHGQTAALRTPRVDCPGSQGTLTSAEVGVGDAAAGEASDPDEVMEEVEGSEEGESSSSNNSNWVDELPLEV